MVTFSAVICCLINYVLATPRGSKALKREIELFQATCHGLTSYVVPKGLSLTAVLVLCRAAKLWTLRAGAAHLFVPPFRNHTHRRQYIALRQSQGISHHLCHKAAPTLRRQHLRCAVAVIHNGQFYRPVRALKMLCCIEAQSTSPLPSPQSPNQPQTSTSSAAKQQFIL